MTSSSTGAESSDCHRAEYCIKRMARPYADKPISRSALRIARWWQIEHDTSSDGTPLFSPSEIASLRRQLKASSAEAVAVAKQHGVKRHPRVIAIKESMAE
jgi:hypothetical protein